jgi:hypothetical protein
MVSRRKNEMRLFMRPYQLEEQTASARARGRAGATAQSYGFFERWLTTDAGLGAVSEHLSNATED